ncbi:MFS transporter [Polymorphobacter sp.]|uniref:MFS transporter n=1 Tax=Polymorphobacter sp. TaxID=1909290 RepID=UPI003F72ED7D
MLPFGLCFIAYVFSQLDLALFAYALPAIRKDWAVSLTAIGTAISIAYVIGGFGQVWMGHLTDRKGRKYVLMAATVLSSLFVAAHALVAGPLTLGLVRAGAIATGGAIYPSTGAMVAEVAPARWRGIYAGLLQAAYPLGWFIASLLAAPILVAFGWRAVFLVGLLSIPYVVVLKRWLPESRHFTDNRAGQAARPSLMDSLKVMLAPGLRRRTITLFAAQLLFVIAYGGSSFLLPTYFTEHRGLPMTTAAYIVGIGNAISIFGYLGAAFIGEFVLTRRTTVVVFTLLGAVGFLAMLWLSTGVTDTLVMFGLMSIFFYGTAAVKFAYIAELFPTGLRATGLAVCGSLAVNLGIAIGPLMISAAVEQIGWQMALSLSVGLPLTAAGVLYLFLKPVPSGLEVDDVHKLMMSKGE